MNYNNSFRQIVSRLCIICLLAVVGLTKMAGSEKSIADEVLPDSSNFVQASVIITTPGTELFYFLGHSALRLQCPSADLDYCFSFNTIVDQGVAFNFLLISGQMIAGYEAVKFDDYLKPFKESGRGVYEYPLNLTLEEERALWKLMDDQMLKGMCFKFDFLFNNCTGPLFRSLESIMKQEKFVYTNEYPLTLNTRERMKVSLGSPWFDFFSVIMLSAYYRDDFPLYMKVYPELWGRLLVNAEIVGVDGSRRPALESPVEELTPQKLFVKNSPITPTWVFGCLFALVLLVTYLEVAKRWQRLSKTVDIILFTAYTLFSLYLLYASCIQLFGTFHNWFLIVFNPLPILGYVFFRKKPFYYKFWLVFVVVLMAFMVFLPLYMGKMEWPHEFLLATLLVRSIANYKSLKLTVVK